MSWIYEWDQTELRWFSEKKKKKNVDFSKLFYFFKNYIFLKSFGFLKKIVFHSIICFFFVYFVP